MKQVVLILLGLCAFFTGGCSLAYLAQWASAQLGGARFEFWYAIPAVAGPFIVFSVLLAGLILWLWRQGNAIGGRRLAQSVLAALALFAATCALAWELLRHV